MINLPEWIRNKETSSQIHPYNKKIWAQFRFYTQAIWKRIVNWKNYPSDYMHIYESQGIYTLYHLKNNFLIHTQNISVEDRSWQEYISKHTNSSIYLIVQGQDCEFRALPTNKIRMWDRFFLFNQIKTNEFSSDDLVGHYQPKQYSERIDIFVSIRSSEQLQQIFRILALLQNPVGGVLSWDIEQSLVMKKYASIVRPLRAWIVTVIPIDSNNMTILILHQDKILLQRVIFTKTTDDLEKELRSTLRFLQRQGYKEGQAVSVLIAEDNYTNEFSNTELELIRVPKKLLEKEIYKPIKPFLNFIPQTLSQVKLAHELPRLSIKFLIPISIILLILWASVQIKSFFQDYENKWIINKHEKISKKVPKNFNEQVHLSSLFKLYINNSSQNSFNTINNIKKLLKDKIQVSSITWNLTEHGSELRLKLPQLAKKTQGIKKYINSNSKKIFGDATLAWNEHAKDTILSIQQRAGQHGN